MRWQLKCKWARNLRIDFLLSRVKSDSLKLSLDYLANSDFEICGTVLGELDMVKDVWFMSDKC